MVEAKVKNVAPEGGWGWVIVIGFAFSNIISIPILQGFGLLFRNVFAELELSATDISTIINVNSGFGLMLGLMNGPLLRMFGFRKHAIAGSIFMFLGFLMTTQAKSFYEFIFYYGVLNSIGFSMSMSAFSLAVNTYFHKKRSMAAGVNSTLTGLGPVIMPLLISRSIDFYGSRGTGLILAGLLLNSFATSLLLQPIKWHYVQVQEDILEEEAIGEKELEMLNPIAESENENEEEMEKYDSQVGISVEDVMVPRKISETTGRRSVSRSRLSLHEKEQVIEPESMWWKNSNNTIDTLKRQESTSPSVKTPKKKNRWFHKVIQFFDLDLLKDPIYRNIWIGMSLAFTGEINFSLMTPLILGDRKFGIEQTARIMSVIATTDIIFRFISPFVGDRLKIPPRQMYMISLTMLVISRFFLALVHTYWETVIVGAALGVAKGFRTVYMSLVIPNHVPLEKLASASGLQTVLNGILLLALGPVLGLARDKIGNYNICIHIINLLSVSTIVLWSVEMVYRSRNNKQTENV